MTATPESGVGRTWNGLTIPPPGTYTFDPMHSHVGFVARHLMVSKVRGSFTKVSGEVMIAENPVESTVTAVIPAASIDTGVADRDVHLRSGDFLDVEKYPDLTFHSTSLAHKGGGEFTLRGNLAIRDVTREVELALEFDGLARSPWGKNVIGFTATTELDREEFGVTWNQALETGGVVVGKKVAIEITVEAIQND